MIQAVKTYKELIVTNTVGKQSGMGVKIILPAGADDEKIFNVHKAMSSMFDGSVSCNINLKKENVNDGTTPPVDPPVGPVAEEFKVTLTNMKYDFVFGGVLTDEDVYGDLLDGKNRRANMYWKDAEQVEHLVPLEGFDEANPLIPNKHWNYNSETKLITFGIGVFGTTEYTLKVVR